MTIAYTLTLEYQLQAGWLEPYINGLLNGKAVARCCSACKKTSFPPVRVCMCSNTSGDWVSLTGEAQVLNRCDGSDGSYGLVHFLGADTRTVVRLKDMAESNQTGYLQTSEPGSPALVLAPASGEAL